MTYSPHFVYLAGPIAGCSWDEAVDWRNYAARRFAEYGVRALSPMRAKDALTREKSISSDFNNYSVSGPFYTSRGIMTRDSQDVRRCDAMLVNLLGTTKMTCGTIMELGWGFLLPKLTVVAIEDEGNLHDQHPMVHEAIGGLRFPSLDAAIEGTLIAMGVLG